MSQSVNKIFYSRENFNLLKDTIRDFCKTNLHNNNINNEFDTLIFMTMEYLDKKVGMNVPDSLSNDQYLTLLNKKVLKLSLSKIIEKNQTNNKNIQTKEKEIIKPRNIENNNQYQFFNSFDTSGLNPNLIDPVLPLPKSQNRINNEIEVATQKL